MYWDTKYTEDCLKLLENEFNSIKKNHIPLNHFIDENALHLVVPCAGFSKDDIKVDIDGDNLFVEGSLEYYEDPNIIYIKRQFKPNNFTVKYTIPKEYDITTLTATCKDGVLCITCNKRPIKKAKKVSINVN